MNTKKIFIVWFFVFLLASLILAQTHFASSSNDSKYYAELVVRSQNATLENLLTVKWGKNYWGFDPLSYNFDLFPGHLLLGVLVSKLGIPAEHALHILGMVFQIGSVFLLVHIAGCFISYQSASILYYSILLTPMAFSYNIRANHELGIMFFSFLALFSGLKYSHAKYWGIASLISTVMLLWIKGPFFIFGPILATLGFLFSRQYKKQFFSFFVLMILIGLCVVGSAFLLESMFFKITKQSFLENFWNIQIQQRQIPYNPSWSFMRLRLYNLYYYTWHVFVYALPWTLFLSMLVIKDWRKTKEKWKEMMKAPIVLFFLLAIASFVIIFVMNNRHAARYIFPAYYLFSALSILIFYFLSDSFQKIHQKILNNKTYFIAPSLWFLIFVLHLVTAG